MSDTVVVYYSYSGNTKRLAGQVAEKLGAALCEIVDVERPGVVKTWTKGSLAAHTLKSWTILPLECDLHEYDEVVLMGPVWWGGPAPQLNSVVEILPEGKRVQYFLTAGGGTCPLEAQVRGLVEARGCTVSSFLTVKTADIKQSAPGDPNT